jgi:uncharacterized phiE125 gp8 family phage protein
MLGNLKVITPPSIEPVSLAEAVAQCHTSTGIEDDWFNGAIKTAREAAEGFQRRALLTQTLELTLDYYPSSVLQLPRPPLVEVLSIKIYDIANVETTLSLSDFIIAGSEPARISLAHGRTWPSTVLRSIDALKIRYTAGQATAAAVSSQVKSAILLHISWQYENRSGETELPEAFYNLLRPKRIHL